MTGLMRFIGDDGKTLIAKITDFALPIIVVISAAYEYFYFKGLGIDLEKTPLGTADFIRGWLVWLPVLIPFALGNLLSQGLILSLGPSRSDESIASAQRSPVAIRLANTIFWCLFTAGTLLLLSYVLIGEQIQFILQACVACFGTAILAKIPTKGLTEHQEKSALTYLISIAFIAYFSFYGFSQGSAVLDDEFAVNHLNLRQTTKLDGISYDVIRVFDQWTLARVRPKRYVWIHNQSNHTLEFEAGRWRYQGLRCLCSESHCYIDTREKAAYN